MRLTTCVSLYFSASVSIQGALANLPVIDVDLPGIRMSPNSGVQQKPFIDQGQAIPDKFRVKPKATPTLPIHAAAAAAAAAAAGAANADATTSFSSSLPPPSPSASQSPTPRPAAKPCWDSLNCTLFDLASEPMPVRLEFLDQLRSKALVPLNSYDQFGAVEGTMKFFINKELGEPGTWVAVVNAAVLEAIMRGALIASGRGWMNDTGGNPGSVKWAAFFERMTRGRLIDRTMHDLEWALAEGACVNYGDQVASKMPDIEPPSTRIRRWEKLTNLYRIIMQYRRTILWLLKLSFGFTNPAVAAMSEAFIDWLTDITKSESVEFLGDLAWSISAIGFNNDRVIVDIDDEMKVLKGLAAELLETFKTAGIETGEGC